LNTIPNRLKINGRHPDNNFDDDSESLYRRLKNGWWPVNPDTLHLLIQIPRLCVARGRYCESPADVLYTGSFDEGIIEWKVGDVPAHVCNDGTEAFLRLVHVLEADIDFYPHSEIQTFRSEDDTVANKPSRTLRAKIRWLLARCARLVKEPSGDL